MIPENKILEIRNKANIVDIISSYINVEKKGKNYFSLCPFHDDTNPSMSISEEKQIFNCFVCNTGGNVFTFVKEYENVSFPESVKIVGDKVGININYTKQQTKNSSPSYKILELSAKFYYNNLYSEKGKKALNYLHKRNILDNTIKDFEIGYALDEFDSITKFLETNDFNYETLTNSGISSKNEGSIYDVFRNRIVIPIKNLEGHTVGFSGRIFNNEDLAKYINTKETDIFKKGEILFNYHQAKQHTKKTKEIIVVEGHMDVIKMHSVGIKNVVALMGTSLTKEGIIALKRLNSKINLLLDQDEAGIKATLAIGDELLKNNLNPIVTTLGQEKDPDDYIEKFGAASLNKLINNPSDFIDFKINYLKSVYNLKNTNEFASFINEIINTISYLDELSQNILIDKLSKDQNIDASILKEQLLSRSSTTNLSKPIIPKKENIKELTKYEKISNLIFYYLLNEKKYLLIYKKELNFFKTKLERTLFGAINKYITENNDYKVADFLLFINNDEEIYNFAINILNKYYYEIIDEQKFLLYVNAMKEELKREKLLELTEKIKKETNDDIKMELILELSNIKMEGKNENH